jgi:hypothetical protein
MPTAPYVLSIDSLDDSDKPVYRTQTAEGERIDVPRVGRFTKPGQTEWAWPGKVPLRKVTLIEGAAGSGKSFVALNLAARINGARDWPDGQARVLPDADVLVLCRNDDPSRTISARFQQAGGDPARLFHFHEFATLRIEDEQHGYRPFLFPFDMVALEDFLEDHPTIGVIIIDPLSDFCETPRQLTETLFKLEDLADRANAVILVTLPADCRTDAQGRLKVKSRWATDVARCAWCIIADPDDPRRRLFVARRTNFCAEPDGLAFTLSDAGVVWDASQPIDPHDPLGKLSGCKRCLEELMSQGEAAASQVFRQGTECGFTPKEMRAAAKRLKVSSARVGYGGEGRWVWSYGEARPITDQVATAVEEAVANHPLPLEEGRGEGAADAEHANERGERPDGEVPRPASGGRGTGEAQRAQNSAGDPLLDQVTPCEREGEFSRLPEYAETTQA